MQTVWQHSKASGPALLVMLAIADNANDAGVAWPAVNTIAKKARCSPRTVQRIFSDLIGMEELRIEKNTGRAGCNRYHITLTEPRQPVTPASLSPRPDVTPDNLTGCQVVRGDIAMSPGGVTQLCQGGGDTAMSPEPSLNRQLEPSVAGPGDSLTGCQDDVGAETVLDTKSLDYGKAEALLDYLIAQAGIEYPKSRLALDAAAIALQGVSQDLDGAKRTVRRQVQLFLSDVKKTAWLRPVTLFHRERFANAYAERDLPAAGSGLVKNAGAQRLAELRGQLALEKSPQGKKELRDEIERLQQGGAAA